MTVKELIAKLNEFPEDMPIAVQWDIARKRDGTIESDISVSIREWEHSNYPYDLEPFKFVNIDW